MKNARITTIEELRQLFAAGQLTGFYIVSDEDYHGGPGVSASGLCDFLRSPAHYRAAKAKSKTPTDAMVLGTQCHEFLLQPERFHARYLVEPEGIDGPKNRHPWKAKWDEFKAQCEVQEKQAIDRGAWATISGIGASVCAHPSAGMLLDGAICEIAAYVQDAETGFVRKAKADIALSWGIADLKTTDDARQEAFTKTIRNFHYHVKAAWYLDVFNALLPEPMDAFIWIAAEKAAPYGVACYAASPRMLEHGRKVYQKALETMQTCVENDVWPCYPGDIQPIELPEYAYRDGE